VLILRIRQAEVALADGRLDEAYELCQSEQLRSHRRGQSLVTALVRALVKRGQEHLSTLRAQQAIVDVEKAARLGGNLPEVVELRTAAQEAIVARQRSDRRHAHALVAAREQIEAGRLAAGQQLLAQAGAESRAAMLMQDVNIKRAMVEATIQFAQAAFERDDLYTAAAELIKARQSDAGDVRVIDLSLRVCKSLKQRAASALAEGRLDLVEAMVERLVKLDDQSVETQQYQRCLEQVRAAWAAVDHGQPAQAEEILRRLLNLFPEAAWTKDALRHASQAQESLEALRGGPLGLLSTAGGVRGDAPTQLPFAPDMRGVAAPAAHEPPRRPVPARDAAAASSESLPSKFMIQVDGAGTFYVLRSPLVTLGPISSSRLPDVGLIA
jgi:hypothetical protein